ncbi:MAG: tetratricopeptide repeat protein [Acidimicrobiia bacterium]|nr:tetratricopeptide repeat protein [Acidimicrobiia bacterium]
MSIDVTDATFEAEILERSATTPVVVDLWAPWCGPCVTLGPILEKVVDATGGQVVLAKVNVDENPKISAAFQAQSIPAVHAIKDRNRVGGFVGAQGEAAVAQFVNGLLPTETEVELARLVAAGDEQSLRAALDIEPGHEVAIVALAELLIGAGETDEALGLLERIPETPETRRVAALARTGGAVEPDDIDRQLTELLDQVKGDDDARQKFVDLLEVLGSDDPRTADYRKKLTARLY